MLGHCRTPIGQYAIAATGQQLEMIELQPWGVDRFRLERTASFSSLVENV